MYISISTYQFYPTADATLDEPASGSNSQTAWSIYQFLRTLASRGQAISCTIHQPSAPVFETFNRLLILAQGGHTLYCGDIGPNAETLIGYFLTSRVRPCEPEHNPAEWIIEIMKETETKIGTFDWKQTWLDSAERKDLQRAITNMNKSLLKSPTKPEPASGEVGSSYRTLIQAVTTRNLQQDWRTPSYLASKLLPCALSVSPASL